LIKSDNDILKFQLPCVETTNAVLLMHMIFDDAGISKNILSQLLSEEVPADSDEF